MEADAIPFPPPPPPVPRTPEGIRQRQRDRLSPRRGFSRASRSSAAARGGEGAQKNQAVAPTPKSIVTGNRHLDFSRKRQLQDDLRRANSVSRRAQKEPEDAKQEITPEGSSAGREGRQFTVANVGNNGRIYLRPSIRPANQRYPQPPFSFPITPPSTSGLDALVSLNEEREAPFDGSVWTPTPSPSTQLHARDGYFSRSPPHAPAHKRAHSYSTVDEQHVSALDSDPGVFKVVIERPGTAPKAEEPFGDVPTLEIPIPSYRLGTPQFSIRGTPFLRGSSYTSADGACSTAPSHRDASQQDMVSHRHLRGLSRRHSDASSQAHHHLTARYSPFAPSATPSISTARRRTQTTPDIFDDLTFKPACDHPSVVRYFSNGGIKAATPARLVAEITSPNFVDYHLVSDFFLTFRSYLEPSDLLHMLIARLKWAFARDDGTGMVVRVRTFVAIRHWILNYFLDDYVVDYDLRKSFCDLVNTLVDAYSGDPVRAKVSLKILGELKKCWRRVCASYWDAADLDAEIGPEIPISPGGAPGSQSPILDPGYYETQPAGPPYADNTNEPNTAEAGPRTIEAHSIPTKASHLGHDGPIATTQITLEPQAQNLDEPPLSPTSIVSEEFISCSFPPCMRAPGGTNQEAHPVPAGAVDGPVPLVAITPKTLTRKRTRPAHSPKRTGSFSDSSRDNRAQQILGQKVVYQSSEPLPTLPYGGSLVRGNIFPPGQAFVDFISPGTPVETARNTIVSPTARTDQRGPSAMSGPGMKKLLSSVRRALSTRAGPNPNSSPTQGSFPYIPPLGVRGATANRLPGTAVVPQARTPSTAAKAPMRIDLLAAEVAENFQRAVREDAEADAGRREEDERHLASNSEQDPDPQHATSRPITMLEPPNFPNPTASTSLMTSGSKSIVIVDDTMTIDLPVMEEAPPASASVDTFTDAFILASEGLTPPSTPPERPLGTPRRSSNLLGKRTRARSISFDATVSSIMESRLSGEFEDSPGRRPVGRPSWRSRGLSSAKQSISLRRYASYQSGYTRHKSERSFDATTISESIDFGQSSRVPSVITPPSRVLRRRAGGDLRAVANLGSLGASALRRPMSTGSLVTYSDSARSSYMLGGDSSDFVDVAHPDYGDQATPHAQTFSLGALAEALPKKPVSLFSTHSSRPVMRPSFEKEVQMLAQIPDDHDDDGGVESALLKLEGKYEQRRSGLQREGIFGGIAGAHNSFGPPLVNDSTLPQRGGRQWKKNRRQNYVVDTSILMAPQPQTSETYLETEEQLKPIVYQPSAMQVVSIATSPRSVESYNPTPLLERGSYEGTMDPTDFRDWSELSVLREPSPERLNEQFPESPKAGSFDFITKPDGMDDFHPNHASSSEGAKCASSFLQSDSEDDVSDLSSELSLVLSRTEYTEHDSTSTQTFPPLGPGTIMKQMALPSGPLPHPPSPPLTLVQALQLTPTTSVMPQRRKWPPREQQQSPSPETAQKEPTIKFNDVAALPSMDPLKSNRLPEASRKTSVHLPFTLAFDSQVLAQQFTLIEKDALNEIDWKDLIEMRWKDASTDSRSWVDFLRTSEPRGVEVVIARFNLMVKWTVSECLLTQDLEERVRCISKYIHIAIHCRKYRNFATMTQLTIALTSKDISRLTKTWEHVPAADIQTLRELETLITPTGNFHSLRSEMEGSGAGQGCIPFLGIYTHDLLVNAERPNEVTSAPMAEPLINFERCRTGAMIVKNLLRLLEASQLYRFLPIEGITERCLWMAALSDEEISRYGKIIQE